MLQNLLKKRDKRCGMEEELALMEKRLNALEAGQRKLASILRLAFPAPTELDIEAFLKDCGSNGVLVIDEWNRRKKLDEAVTKI
ncbi:MAG: hypothetical protein ACUZ8E_02395 [Candidatus Anammoxibacter sp.]